MDTELRAIWADINDTHFGGGLTPPNDIDWHPLTGDEDSLEAFAMYLPFARSIAVDERFRYDRKLIAAGDEREEARLELVYRLLIHETVHQVQFDRKLDRPGRHGSSFIDVATPIAASLGIAPPTLDDATRWPEILPLLAHFNL